MMKRIISLLRDRNMILVLALLVGIAVPQFARLSYHVTLPALALVMTLSTMGIPGSVFRDPRALIIPAMSGILMNYVVLGGLILAMSAALIRDEGIWRGFVILAGVPPAVAVIPFTDFLKGDKTYSLVGTIGCYLGGLVLMPLVAFLFMGGSFFNPGKLLIIMSELIIAPLVLSRILLWKGWDKKLGPFRGTMTNWSFFVVVYTIVGLNHEIFVHQPQKLVPVIAIAVGSTFLLGWLIEKAGQKFKVSSPKVMSAVLLGTLKNQGLAGGIALALFTEQTAIPATVSTVFMIVYIIWLSFKKK